MLDMSWRFEDFGFTFVIHLSAPRQSVLGKTLVAGAQQPVKRSPIEVGSVHPISVKLGR